jgi:hypothetical protein
MLLQIMNLAPRIINDHAVFVLREPNKKKYLRDHLFCLLGLILKLTTGGYNVINHTRVLGFPSNHEYSSEYYAGCCKNPFIY